MRLRSDGASRAERDVAAVLRGVRAEGLSLWPTPIWLWNNDAGGGYNTHNWQTVIVRGWMEELGVKHHFANKDGTQVIDLPYPFEY